MCQDSQGRLGLEPAQDGPTGQLVTHWDGLGWGWGVGRPLQVALEG